ncbi:MAG TPA: hypothetical protein VD927_11305 [Chryseosolibacter sp.]|nr:hypothetical protein [Chryseosolibacter sp.]
MYKTIINKDFSAFELAEIKEDLNIYSGDTSFNSQLNRCIASAVEIAEKEIGFDIALTTNRQTDYCVNGTCYTVYEPNISISGITGTTNNIQTAITGFTTYKGFQYTTIKFDTSINVDELNIIYQSGYALDKVPYDIKRAISIKTAELFDVDRSGYVSNSVRESKAFKRILSHYTNLL